MWAFLQSVGDSDVNYDRQLVLAFFCEYYNRQARAQVLIYAGLVPQHNVLFVQ